MTNEEEYILYYKALNIDIEIYKENNFMGGAF